MPEPTPPVRPARFLVPLSKTVSHALRHAPWLYELELDDAGWVATAPLLIALRSERDDWADISEADLAQIIATSAKQRFEMEGGRIRALYGHSLAGKIKRTAAEPPEHLYHGTDPAVVLLIQASGLLPMARQYVHLSVDRATALEVGHRKARKPVLLRVRATEAHRQGIAFYEGNDKVWLADRVPEEFIDLVPS